MNLKTPDEEELAVDYQRNNQNLDMLLGWDHCAISVCGESEALFLETYETNS